MHHRARAGSSERRRRVESPAEGSRQAEGGVDARGRGGTAAFALILVGCWFVYGFMGEAYMRWALWRHSDAPLTTVIERTATDLGFGVCSSSSVAPPSLLSRADIPKMETPPLVAIARCPGVLGDRDVPEQEYRVLSWLWGAILGGSGPPRVGASVDHGEASFVVVPCTPTGLKPYSHRLLVIGVKEIEGAINGLRSADPKWPAQLTANASSVGLLGYARCSGKAELWQDLLRQFHYVLRIHPDCRFVDNRRVFQFPLGPAVHSGFPARPTYLHPDSTTRSTTLAFQGAVRSGRVEAVRASRAVCKARGLKCVLAPSSTHLLRQGVAAAVPGLAGQLADTSYLTTMRDSAFTLSPAGLYPESFRTYEAMALGSIPIVHNVSSAVRRAGNVCPFPDSHNFLRDLGAPVLFVTDWSELDDVLDEYLTHPEQLRRLQEKLWDWWPQFLTHLKVLILRLALRPPSLSS